MPCDGEMTANICATNSDQASGLDLAESDVATPRELVAALHRHKWTVVPVTQHEILHLEGIGRSLELYYILETQSASFVAEFAERMQIAAPSGSDSAAFCLNMFIDYAGGSFPLSRDSGGLRYLSALRVKPSGVVALGRQRGQGLDVWYRRYLELRRSRRNSNGNSEQILSSNGRSLTSLFPDPLKVVGDCALVEVRLDKAHPPRFTILEADSLPRIDNDAHRHAQWAAIAAFARNGASNNKPDADTQRTNADPGTADPNDLSTRQ
jgi:hypothetical protein